MYISRIDSQRQSKANVDIDTLQKHAGYIPTTVEFQWRSENVIIKGRDSGGMASSHRWNGSRNDELKSKVERGHWGSGF